MPALDTLTFDSLIGKLTGEAEELTDMERETFDLIGPGPPAHEFWGDVASTLSGRRLLRTSKGYFGFGPVAIQKGDVVCVLNHAKTAQILRPRRDMDREVYILVD